MSNERFRAWSTEGKEWIVPSVIALMGTGMVLLYEHSRWVVRYEPAIIISRSTGLKDKNGKEIYAGDVVEYDKDFQGKPFPNDDGYRFEVGFSCGSFLLLDPYDTGERGGFSGFYLHTPALTVIGNIYETPHLLTHEA